MTGAFEREDSTYVDLRKKSLNQWLEQMEESSDVAVRGGIPLVRNYIDYLEREIEALTESNELKSKYLKKMKYSHK